jgi:hypothetical protein
MEAVYSYPKILGNSIMKSNLMMVILERHVNQLRKTEIPKRPISFATSMKSEEDNIQPIDLPE